MTWKQSSLTGQKLELPTQKDLNTVCCESCYNALEETCTCKCHGAYHGLGRLNKREQDAAEQAFEDQKTRRDERFDEDSEVKKNESKRTD